MDFQGEEWDLKPPGILSKYQSKRLNLGRSFPQKVHLLFMLDSSMECNTSTTKLQYTKNTQNAMLMIRDDAGGTRFLKIDNFFWTPQTMKNAGFKH